MAWRKFAAALIAALLIFAAPSAAYAGGSNDPTPYTVSAEGITLPAGAVFRDGGHVNIAASKDAPRTNVHFDPNNGHPGGQWIGKSFIPWSAFGITSCTQVGWVQIHGYNEHYGEGGQPPIGALCSTPEPQPEIVETWVWWLVAPGGSKDNPWPDGQPQTFISEGYDPKPTLKCGETAQGDAYRGTRAAIDAVIGDGLLLNAEEDSGIYQRHEWLYGGDCEPEPTPTPTEPEEEPSPTPTPTTPSTTPSPEPSPEPSSGSETPTPVPSSTPEPEPSSAATETPQVSSSESPTSTPTSSTSLTATPHEELAATGFRSLMVWFGAALVLIVGGALIKKGYPPKP